MEQITEGLRAYVLGWKAYFRLAQTPAGHGDAGRMAAAPAAGHSAEAVAARARRCSANYGRSVPAGVAARWQATRAAGGATAAWA